MEESRNSNKMNNKHYNPMRQIYVEKITLNIGAGTDKNKLEKGIKLIKYITGKEPVKTITNKRIPSWSLRPKLPIGCKLTLRGKEAEELLKKLLDAKNYELKSSSFDSQSNVSFGLEEYVNIPGVKYNHEIGMMGFEVAITLSRPGYRVKKRKIKPSKIGKKHLITKQEAIEFMKEKFNCKIIE